MSSRGSSDWSFNLRERAICLESDASDEEEPERPAQTEDARLLKEMDLTTREDTAQYKANPWSIAKINAASRTARQGPETAIPALQKKEGPKGQIVDGFKKQAERAKTTKSNANDPSTNPSRLPFPVIKPGCSIATQTVKRQPGAVLNRRPNATSIRGDKCKTDVNTDEPASAFLAAPKKELPLSEPPISTEGAHIPMDNVPSSAYPLDAWTPSTVLPNPVFGPDHSLALDASTDANTDVTPAPSADPHSAEPANWVRAGSNVHIPSMSNRAPPSDNHPLHGSQENLDPISLPRRRQYMSLSSPPRSLAFQNIFDTRHARSSPIQDASRFSYRTFAGEKHSSQILQLRTTQPVSSSAMPAWLASALPQPSSSHKIRSTYEVEEQFVSPAPVLHDQPGNSASRRKPFPSSRSSTPPRPKARPVSAYAHPSLDDEEEWSTLPPKKKTRLNPRTTAGGVQRSGGLKLPLALAHLGGGVPVREDGPSASKRRVITYFPPPMNPTNAGHDDDHGTPQPLVFSVTSASNDGARRGKRKAYSVQPVDENMHAVNVRRLAFAPFSNMLLPSRCIPSPSLASITLTRLPT
ncbi:hypothetical protein OE88DRAFT_303092 [Heliocybe sulcata]|uniref:Uncharacterized protein n=1 Tax=Heliocybe sulcata TaxID=5364 RepID=A0A5C3MZ01_9AGAM|nr:hypothetical protein OE88DRAFT_303092 [Heliocybe sulcata]